MVPVYFVVAPRIVLLDVAGPAEAFRAANKFAPGSFDVHYCGPEPDVESGLAGLRLGGLEPLPDRLPANALVVLSGMVGASPDWLSPAVSRVVHWLARRQPADGFTLMSVCAGALVAASAGLLHGRECTSHHACLDALARLAPTARVHDNRIFVEDGNLLRIEPFEGLAANPYWRMLLPAGHTPLLLRWVDADGRAFSRQLP